jgi:hypothetical protein
MSAHGRQLESELNQLASSTQEASATQKQQATTIVDVVQEPQKSVTEISKKMAVLDAHATKAAAALALSAPATRGAAQSVAAAAGAATEEFMVDTKGLRRPLIFDARESDGIP